MGHDICISQRGGTFNSSFTLSPSTTRHPIMDMIIIWATFLLILIWIIAGLTGYRTPPIYILVCPDSTLVVGFAGLPPTRYSIVAMCIICHHGSICASFNSSPHFLSLQKRCGRAPPSSISPEWIDLPPSCCASLLKTTKCYL